MGEVRYRVPVALVFCLLQRADVALRLRTEQGEQLPGFLFVAAVEGC